MKTPAQRTAAAAAARRISLPVAAIVEDQDRHAKRFPEREELVTMTKIAGVAVAVEDRVLGAGMRTPPGVKARAVGGCRQPGKAKGPGGLRQSTRPSWFIGQVTVTAVP